MSQDRHMQLLGPVDSAFWFLDTPRTPMNIGSILIFDGKLNYEKLVELIDSRLHQAPLYQQKVISAPFSLGEPMWVYDTEFHIFNHMYRRTLPQPGTEEQLKELVGRLMSRRLRRDKPLWEAYMIEGLENNRTALMFKVHHAMVDGISAIDLFSMIMDLDDSMPTIDPKPPYNPPEEPTTMQLLGHNMRKGIPHRVNTVKRLGNDLLGIGINLLERRQRKNVLMGLLSIIHDHLTPISPLPINGDNTGKLAIAWSEFALEDILAIRRKEKVSVNDIMLTLLGMAIGRYSEEEDSDLEQDFVRMIMPVNMRDGMDDETNVGNRISMLPIEVPFDASDVTDCLQQVSRYSQVMKESELAKNFDIALSLPSLMHPVVQPLIWGAVPSVFGAVAHTWCTNVAGPPMGMYLLGCEMTRAFGYLPLNPSMGLANTVLSYNGKITLTIAADKAIVPDVNRLRNHVLDVYQELCETTGIGLDSVEELMATKIEAPAEPEADVASNNGHVAQDATASEDAPSGEATEAGAVAVATPIKLMSEEWAQALHKDINNSEDYYNASKRWTKGQIAMVLHASPDAGYPQAQAVLLDLHKGKCRGAHNVPVSQAVSQASFVLEAPYDNWMNVLERRAKAIPSILKGDIKLSKGSMRQLMPFTKSSTELVRSAIRVTQK